MEPSVYRQKWIALKNTPGSEDALSQLARQVAFSFVDRFYQKGLYRDEYIDLLGEIAALISDCNEFIGYDSACQHIAAAVQTPTMTIFAGSNNMHFIQRWSACGDTQCKILHVNTLTDPGHIDTQEVVVRIMNERAAAIVTVREQPQKILEIKTSQRLEKPAQKTVDG